jgi:hypothetical protein
LSEGFTQYNYHEYRACISWHEVFVLTFTDAAPPPRARVGTSTAVRWVPKVCAHGSIKDH